MASSSIVTNKEAKTNDHAAFRIDFDAELQSEVCGELIVAIIKYLLYQREQIPEIFDAIASWAVDRERNSPATPNSLAAVRDRLHRRMVIEFTQTFQELFTRLRELFVARDKSLVRRVVILIGSTPVTPREVHCIEVPQLMATPNNSRPRSDVRAITRQCLARLFHTLVKSTVDVRFETLPVTNVTVMLEMLRSTLVSWFLPKTYFQLPAPQGRHFFYRIAFPSPVFHIYPDDDLLEDQAPTTTLERPESEYIWFQMPAMVKGLSNYKPPKHKIK